jgi:DnaJ-class molecular chaperone
MAKKKPPHEVLGVKPGATAAEIDKAYRKKSREAHPDRGGSSEAMHELQDALRRINKPETDDDEKEDALHGVMLVFGQCYTSVLHKMLDNGQQPEFVNLVNMMFAVFREGAEAYRAAIAEAEKQERITKRAIKRFKRKNGDRSPNFMHNVLEHHLDALEKEKREAKKQLDTNAECQKMLGDIAYETDRQPEPPFMSNEWLARRRLGQLGAGDQYAR